MEGSDDVIVDKFSISRGGKTLFRASRLALVHGRRYGLIGALARPRADVALAEHVARLFQARTAAARAPS